MATGHVSRLVWVVFLGLLVLAGGLALANGGPFVVKYPAGDPAAKGILARLDPDLKPRHETRLRVVKEDLKVTFAPEARSREAPPPLAGVSAAYTIENPTAAEIEVDFGFPILRGIYLSPYSMTPSPDVHVQVNDKQVPCVVISNSAIYGIVRQRARRQIDRGIARDAELARLMFAVRGSEGQGRLRARAALTEYLTGQGKWNPRDAALMVEYASLELGQAKGPVAGAGWNWSRSEDLTRLASANLGPLAAVGEQKATQFFAQLGSRCNPKVGASYEAVFAAWGGDVRERSVDLATGRVRPREITVDRKAMRGARPSADGLILGSDPTVYARVDYLDENRSISEVERTSCKAILKNLPVVFTFAPMNLLHYRVKFPPKTTQTLTVTYSQYPYADTRTPSSYQLAYVVHPASLWKEFGPINLEVAVPEGVGFRASKACRRVKGEERTFTGPQLGNPTSPGKTRFAIYRAALTQKRGELFLAVDSAAWKKVFPSPQRAAAGETQRPVARKAVKAAR